MRVSQTAARLFVIAAIALGSLIVGCGQSGDNSNSARPDASGYPRLFTPPEPAFARGLGITGGPITSEQARAIAEAATGGVAKDVEQEDEDGVQVFGVAIEAADNSLDVKIRIADGAVTKIEADDPDDEGSDGDEGSDSDTD